MNGLQMTLQELNPEICQRLIVTVLDFRVKLSRFLESEGDLKIQEELCSLRSCGLLKSDTLQFFSQKTLEDFLTMRGGRTFGTIINTMADLGYDVEWQVLNSKNYGVPQNRERVFIIGHFGRAGGRKVFPLGEDATKIDVVQGQVANTLTTRTEGDGVGTYVIEDKQLAQIRRLVGGHHQGAGIYDSKGLSITLTSQGGGIGANTGLYVVPENGVMIKETTAKGHTEAVEGDSINLSMPCSQGALEGKRVRRLTPRECFRLQGFPDEAYEKAAEVNSDSQLYKQAGNSVTVNVIYEIAKRLEGENAHKTSKNDD